MIIDDLTDARLLVGLAKQLNFGVAARRLSMPTATASRRLARMETRAGVRLFERTTRMVSATPAGNLAIHHAQKLLLEAEEIDLSIAAMQADAIGSIRLTTRSFLARRCSARRSNASLHASLSATSPST